MIVARPFVVAVVLVLTLGAGAHAEDAAGTARRPHERPRMRFEDLVHQEQQIRRTRAVVRRVLHDRRASDAVKQQAADLDALLDRRQQLIDRLQQRHAAFAAQHQADIDELAQLNQRAHEIDERLAAARKDVLDGAKDDVAALQDASTRAADLADKLRLQYMQERRPQRGRTPAPPAAH